MRIISKQFYPTTVFNELIYKCKISPIRWISSSQDSALEEALQIRQKYQFSNVPHAFKEPIIFKSGQMQWLFDHSGRKFLDMYGSIATSSVGHCNPKVREALKSQLDKLWHVTAIYMNPTTQEYVQKLALKLPENLQTIYFVNSGSEANDLAMLLSRLYTKNNEIISLRNSYHGNTQHVMGLTAITKNKFGIPGVSDGIHHIMNPDPYNGIWGGKYCRDSLSQTDRNCNCDPSNCEAATKYVEQLEELFKYSIKRKGCAAMFIEPIQGFGGAVQYPKGYVKKAAELIRSEGGLVVMDEVQTGFGRTGEHFWAFEGHDIVPDIVTFGKGIANGFPLAGLATSKEIAQTLNQAAYFGTFSGSALACSAALAVLNVIEEDKLQENAFNIGNYTIKKLLKLREKYEIIGDVRGKGLMLAVELVEDKVSKKPLNMEAVNNIFEECKDHGIIFGKGGLNLNVIRIKPSLIISSTDIDFALSVLESVISKYNKNT